MKISAIQQSTYSTNAQKIVPQKELYHSAVSFKASLTTGSTVRSHLDAINGTKNFIKKIKEIDKIKEILLENYQKAENSPESAYRLFQNISEMNGFLDMSIPYRIYQCFRKNKLPYIFGIKEAALKLFSETDDKDSKIRNSKEAFMQSLFNFDEYRNEIFTKKFNNLSDKYYSDFKQNLVDKIFAKYKNTNNKNQRYDIYDLRIALTLDKKVYNKFIQERCDDYQNLKNNLLGDVCKIINKEKNLAYKYHSYRGSYGREMNVSLTKTEISIFKAMLKIIINDAINSTDNELDQVGAIAKKLNIEQACANDILKDYTALAEADAHINEINMIIEDIVNTTPNEEEQISKVAKKLQKMHDKAEELLQEYHWLKSDEINPRLLNEIYEDYMTLKLKKNDESVTMLDIYDNRLTEKFSAVSDIVEKIQPSATKEEKVEFKLANIKSYIRDTKIPQFLLSISEHQIECLKSQ